MASFFRNVLASGIGATEQLIMTTGALTPNANPTANTTVIGLSLTNTTENIVLASIRLDNGPTSAYFVKEVAVPPNQSLRVINGGEKLILAPDTDVYMSSSSAASLDLVLSCVEIV
jgi:hypothetical protein